MWIMSVGCRFKHSADADKFADGLRKAGLAE
jgi:hypothetical protein